MGMTIEEAIKHHEDMKKGWYLVNPDELLDFTIEIMRKYQQLQADYENRLKADMVAILTEIQLEIAELMGTISPNYDEAAQDISKVIQQKINDIAHNDCKLPSVTPQEPRWIPVSERLPEDRREVLVTAYWHETYQVMMASYFGDGLWWCVPFNNCGEHMQRLKPKAWMPLPPCYEPQESEE